MCEVGGRIDAYMERGACTGAGPGAFRSGEMEAEVEGPTIWTREFSLAESGKLLWWEEELV